MTRPNRCWNLPLSLLLLLGTGAAWAGEAPAAAPLLVRQPAVNATDIVFCFAGDLWRVPRAGGTARRLTTGPGVETDPWFSPDGRLVAFSGQYDGNWDVFVIPASGGEPRRLTWHPGADLVQGWTPDGRRVLFSSNRTAHSRYSELFTVDLEGGLPERVPLPMAYRGTYRADGHRLAYEPLPRMFAAWKRYRGGTATPIWLADLETSQVEEIPRAGSNDFNPMWVGDQVYFLSDRDGPVTLFAYDTHTRDVRRVLDNSGLCLKSASAGPGAIVYEQFGSLHLFDTETGRSRPVPVNLAGDWPEVRERFVNVGARLTQAGLSPKGVRAVFEARGEIVTVPLDKGDWRNLTRTPGVMERDPAWSPDGRLIAYFSDEAGEYALHLAPHDGVGEVRRITLDTAPTFYFSPRWSPDSRRVAYVDVHLGLWVADLETGATRQVDKDRFWGHTANLTPSWSPDSRWLTYVKRLPNYLGAVFVHHLESGVTTQVTDGMSDAQHPVFDADGKHLYFTASTDSGRSYQPDILSAGHAVTRSVYVAVLSADDPSPLGPESDEETVRDPGAPAAPPEKEKPRDPVRIDLEKLLRRVLVLPLPARPYVALLAGRPGAVLALERTEVRSGPPGGGLTIHRHDLASRRVDVVLTNVADFTLAHNGETMLYRQGARWLSGKVPPVPPAGAPAPPAGPGKEMKTSDIQVRVVPRDEWRQMYHDAWRIQREFFYDPGLHGLDLPRAIERYAPFVDGLASRNDLNYLFAEMMGEITVGHLSVFGGDRPDVPSVSGGLLGCDFEFDQGRYRFRRVYDGENWNPRLRAPLAGPGVDVQPGEYLLAVGGVDLRAGDNVHRLLEGLADRQVELTIGPTADGREARRVTVVPVANEAGLRNRAWIEDNRRHVDQVSGGRVAYVYMPDTTMGGYESFNRYFYAQVGREALIVDERFNAGGALATDIIEKLQRRLMSLVATRAGEDEAQPQGAIFGPKVMLINEIAGSGGDAMPWYFRRAGIGPLVGKRTWGGLVGRAGAPRLMDGGIVTAPSSGVWSPDGEWIAENVGVAPDVEVELDPAMVRQGRDPQLEKALELVLAELERNPPPRPRRPAYPDYHNRN